MINLKTLNLVTMRAAIVATVELTGREIADKMSQPTATWSSAHRPKFGVVGPEMEYDDLVAFAGVLPGQGEKAKVYRWITRGTITKPGINIVPVRAKRLRFYSPYYPATNIRDWTSRTAEVGDELNLRSGVHHPGVEPREFEELAAEEARRVFAARIRAAVAGIR